MSRLYGSKTRWYPQDEASSRDQLNFWDKAHKTWVASMGAVHVLNFLSSACARLGPYLHPFPLLLSAAITCHALEVVQLLEELLQQATPSLVVPPDITTILH